MNVRKLSTILAALRHWQTLADCPPDLWTLATNVDEYQPLDNDEIDKLCAELVSNIATLRITELHVVATGSAFDGGMALHGPFMDFESAHQFAKDECRDTGWNIVEVQKPDYTPTKKHPSWYGGEK